MWQRLGAPLRHSVGGAAKPRWYSIPGLGCAAIIIELCACAQVIVATGFIAKNQAGQVTTLKRNGSDYSATIMGALVRSSNIVIWTDVDGVFSADPRKVNFHLQDAYFGEGLLPEEVQMNVGWRSPFLALRSLATWLRWKGGYEYQQISGIPHRPSYECCVDFVTTRS